MKYFIVKSDIDGFLKTLSVDSRIFYLTESHSYAKYNGAGFTEKLDLNKIRALTPLKAFFLIHGELLRETPAPKRTIILGVKSCDMRAKNILDAFFLEHVQQDDFYGVNNLNTLIFTSDCPEPGKNCFCSLVGGKPYIESPADLRPGTTFDLNFSPAGDGFVVESGSGNGEKVIRQTQAFFKEASSEQISQIEVSRKKALSLMEVLNRKFLSMKQSNLQKLAKDKFHSDWWKKASEKCVQCTGCNMICPSCYCFLLSETLQGKERYWDACHFTAYARMAGGASPRPKVYERFRNRYQCKFNFRMQNYGQYACSGCGRCIEVSPCKIDIRETMSGLI
ncbi:MAG: 4Fe-4S dicluster domain-containing protein [Elusimicrobiota bacterium]